MYRDGGLKELGKMIPCPDFIKEFDPIDRENSKLKGENVYIGGYPMMIYDEKEQKLVKADQHPYCDSGPILDVKYDPENGNTAVMIYGFTGVATGKGQSGASIQYKTKDNKYQVIGVHDGNHDVSNFGTFITMALYFDFIVPNLEKY
jgi:hypothetical protein